MRIIKIGKDKSNDIHKALIDDPGVSRIHCEIFLDDEGNVFLTDKGSTNGTFVNGNKISEPQMLDEFDVIRVGNSVVDWKSFVMNENKKVILKKKTPPIIHKEYEIKHQKTNSYNRFILPVLLLISFVIIYQVYKTSDSSDDTNQILNESKKRSTKPKVSEPVTKKNTTSDNKEPIAKIYDRPKNGFSPYNKYFGKGIYDSSSSSYFLIKNSNATDAVVLLVDAYSRNKIRNEYIRKGTDFKMTSVPRGTYYLQWVSGNNWSPDLAKGDLVGCFQNDMSFTKTRDRDDWMKVTDLQGWTVTLYTVAGGDVESEKISANDFLN